jgi:hypothetical protein
VIFFEVVTALVIIGETMLTTEIFLAAAPKGNKTKFVTTALKLTPLGSL